jgi:hypothetical protein
MGLVQDIHMRTQFYRDKYRTTQIGSDNVNRICGIITCKLKKNNIEQLSTCEMNILINLLKQYKTILIKNRGDVDFVVKKVVVFIDSIPNAQKEN